MISVECPFKRIDPTQLQAELVAAGVKLANSSMFGDVRAYPDKLLVFVAGNTNADLVRSVVAAHVAPPEKTQVEITKERVAKSIKELSIENLKLRTILSVVHNSLVEVRTAYNQLLSDYNAGMVPSSAELLTNRTLEEVEAEILKSLK